MDLPKSTENQSFVYFDIWMKNKDQTWVFNLKKLVFNVFRPPKASEVLIPLGGKNVGTGYGNPKPKGFSWQQIK